MSPEARARKHERERVKKEEAAKRRAAHQHKQRESKAKHKHQQETAEVWHRYIKMGDRPDDPVHQRHRQVLKTQHKYMKKHGMSKGDASARAREEHSIEKAHKLSDALEVQNDNRRLLEGLQRIQHAQKKPGAPVVAATEHELKNKSYSNDDVLILRDLLSKLETNEIDHHIGDIVGFGKRLMGSAHHHKRHGGKGHAEHHKHHKHHEDHNERYEGYGYSKKKHHGTNHKRGTHHKKHHGTRDTKRTHAHAHTHTHGTRHTHRRK